MLASEALEGAERTGNRGGTDLVNGVIVQQGQIAGLQLQADLLLGVAVLARLLLGQESRMMIRVDAAKLVRPGNQMNAEPHATID
eukprot:COSAG02_NODE_1608_length_11711_cov_5.975026_4_plen_85_part_00